MLSLVTEQTVSLVILKMSEYMKALLRSDYIFAEANQALRKQVPSIKISKHSQTIFFSPRLLKKECILVGYSMKE
jgi:hypothetical protein